MSILYPALLGLGTKLYDDIVDHHIKIPSILFYGIQIATLLLLGITLHGEFYLSYFMGIFGLFNPGFDTTYWKLFTMICLFATLVQYSDAGENVFQNLLILTIPLVLFILITSLEYYHISEEVSLRKLISRVVFLLIAGLSLILPYQKWFHLPIEVHRTLYLFTIIFIFNLLYSIMSMLYLYF